MGNGGGGGGRTRGDRQKRGEARAVTGCSAFSPGPRTQFRVRGRGRQIGPSIAGGLEDVARSNRRVHVSVWHGGRQLRERAVASAMHRGNKDRFDRLQGGDRFVDRLFRG